MRPGEGVEAGAGVAEGLDEVVEEDLGLAFFVTGDVVLSPSDEMGKLVLTRHGNFLRSDGGDVSKEKRRSLWPFQTAEHFESKQGIHSGPQPLQSFYISFARF